MPAPCLHHAFPTQVLRRPRASEGRGVPRCRPALPDGLEPCRADPGHARKPPRPVPVHTALCHTDYEIVCARQACAAPARLYRRCMLYSRTTVHDYIFGVRYTTAFKLYCLENSETRAPRRACTLHARTPRPRSGQAPRSTSPYSANSFMSRIPFKSGVILILLCFVLK